MKNNLLILDCDGVLTPKYRFYSKEGRLFKQFTSDDSYAIKNLKKLDLDIVILTADLSGLEITKARANDWNIEVICSKDKLNEVVKIKQEKQYKKIFFVGDGPEDIAVLNEVNLFFSPKDARPEVVQNNDRKVIVLDVDGGNGVLDHVYAHLINNVSINE